MLTKTADGSDRVLATSAWGTNYEFWPEFWERLPEVWEGMDSDGA